MNGKKKKKKLISVGRPCWQNITVLTSRSVVDFKDSGFKKRAARVMTSVAGYQND